MWDNFVSTFDTDDPNEMIDQITQYVTIQLAKYNHGTGYAADSTQNYIAY
jgi:hypothetical protein